MFKWFEAIFGKKKPEPEKVVVQFQLPDRKIEVEAVRILEYKPQLHCKLHENYSGATVPINNCNVCWEIYSQKCKR
jgi:hypothetical protein